MKLYQFGISLLAVCVIAGVWVGFAGDLHPAADSLSLLRPAGGVFCLILMLALRNRTRRLTLGLTSVAALATTIPFFIGASQEGTLTLYSKNIWFANQELETLAADISDSGANVVTLQEVSHRNDRLLGLLAVDYPHQHLCRTSGWGGVAVLSKHPIIDHRCTSRRGLAAARIDKDGQEVWIGSVHLPWPFPYANRMAADAAETIIDTLDGPVVLAGDFNIFPWAASVRQLKLAAAGQTARPVRTTYSLKGIPLFLDHVHAPGGGQVSYRPYLGSDHLGVLARVDLTP